MNHGYPLPATGHPLGVLRAAGRGPRAALFLLVTGDGRRATPPAPKVPE
jgi:hypothetical protein